MKRPLKFRNEPTEVDGIRFASRAEAKRWQELKLLERAGEIHDLRRQPRYELVVNGIRIGVYVGDFAYLDKGGDPITEDVKGVITDLFRWKAKLFRALMGRDIVLVNAR